MKRYEIYGELNKRTHRYIYFKIFKVSKENLNKIKQSDLSWIERVCTEERYEPREYLDYYLERL